MRSRHVLAIPLTAGVVLLSAAFLSTPTPPAQAQVRLEMPLPVRAEHEMLHTTLIEASKTPGRVGQTARTLVSLLEPHFVREEQMAMPLLGLLAPLANGTAIPDAIATQAKTMSDAIRKEMGSMLDDHRKISAAVAALREAAVAEGLDRFRQLAEDLTRHAQDEETVMYPAAALVGDVLRARQTAR